MLKPSLLKPSFTLFLFFSRIPKSSSNGGTSSLPKTKKSSSNKNGTGNRKPEPGNGPSSRLSQPTMESIFFGPSQNVRDWKNHCQDFYLQIFLLNHIVKKTRRHLNIKVIRRVMTWCSLLKTLFSDLHEYDNNCCIFTVTIIIIRKDCKWITQPFFNFALKLWILWKTGYII